MYNIDIEGSLEAYEVRIKAQLGEAASDALWIEGMLKKRRRFRVRVGKLFELTLQEEEHGEEIPPRIRRWGQPILVAVIAGVLVTLIGLAGSILACEVLAGNNSAMIARIIGYMCTDDALGADVLSPR